MANSSSGWKPPMGATSSHLTTRCLKKRCPRPRTSWRATAILSTRWRSNVTLVKGPVWIEERDTLLLHQRSLILHGGAPGVLDATLLKSALARAHQHYSYVSRVDIIRLAGVYTAGIVQNHPFVDGNKRIGFIVGVLFLELSGYRFTASEEGAAQAVLSLAAGEIDESSFIQFLKGNVSRGRE